MFRYNLSGLHPLTLTARLLHHTAEFLGKVALEIGPHESPSPATTPVPPEHSGDTSEREPILRWPTTDEIDDGPRPPADRSATEPPPLPGPMVFVHPLPPGFSTGWE